MRLAVSTGLPRTSGGWSHSWVTPTSASARPKAQTISVALGKSETTLMRARPQPGQDRLLDRLGMLEHEPLPIADAGGAQRPLGELARRGPDLPHQERLVHEALGGDLAP